MAKRATSGFLAGENNKRGGWDEEMNMMLEWQETTYGGSDERTERSVQSGLDGSRETAVYPEPSSDTVRCTVMPSLNTIKR